MKALHSTKETVVSLNGGVVLRLVPQTTSLYQPEQPGRKENLLFLRMAGGTPPKTIPLEETWAESGTPPHVGYFLFLDAQPTDAKAFEEEIKGSLPAPTASAFAWVVTGSPLSVLTLLKTKLNSLNAPCVNGDTQLNLALPGQASVGFGDGSPILAASSDGIIKGVVVTYPPLAGAQPPSVSGVMLPLAGDYVGCVRFVGLTPAPGGASAFGDSVVKALVIVSLDPLNPLDTSRNRVTFTGASFILTRDANGYHISRAS
jgi:hypothetical protein